MNEPNRSITAAERRVPITEEMSAFVSAHYDQVVRSGLLAPATAIIQPPTTIIATVNPVEGRRRLWAMGQLDSQNVYGALIRQNYVAAWGNRYDPAIGLDGDWGGGVLLGSNVVRADAVFYDELSRAMALPAP